MTSGRNDFIFVLIQNSCIMSTFPGYKTTISKSSNVQDHKVRSHRKRYSSVLSPIYENMAYLDLEHGHPDRDRTSKETVQSSLMYCKEKHRGKRHDVKRRHSDFHVRARRSELYSNDHNHKERRKRDTSVTESIQLKETNVSRTQIKQSSCIKSCTDEQSVAGTDASVNKKRLQHTHSDPTSYRLRTWPKNSDYVGYNVIENFLKTTNFENEQVTQKLKTVRSNSEPFMTVPRQIKHSLFIDAFEDKSKSLEDMSSNIVGEVPVKVFDKDFSNPKQASSNFQPIEAYRNDDDTCTKDNSQPQDEQVPSTSRDVTHSSLYQGHPILDPALLHPQPQGNQNSRRVKLTPVQQREPRSCCPAERKLQNRCFLIFFTFLLLGVVAFVIFVIKGWFPLFFLSDRPHLPATTTTVPRNASAES